MAVQTALQLKNLDAALHAIVDEIARSLVVGAHLDGALRKLSRWKKRFETDEYIPATRVQANPPPSPPDAPREPSGALEKAAFNDALRALVKAGDFPAIPEGTANEEFLEASWFNVKSEFQCNREDTLEFHGTIYVRLSFVTRRDYDFEPNDFPYMPRDS
jgi:hypothetical protein